MADSFITQCPHCQVKFKLTESQLNAANGSVRCGACLNVFNAKENLTENQNKAKKQSTTKKPTPNTTKPTPNIVETKTDIEKPISSKQTDTDHLFDFDNDSSDEIPDDISESLFAGLDETETEYSLPNENKSDYSSDDDEMNSLFADAEEGLNNIFEESKESGSQPIAPLEFDLTSENDDEDEDDQLSDIFSDTQSAESIFDESKNDTSSDLSGLNDAQNDDDEEDFIFGVEEPDELEIDDNFLKFSENNSDAFSDDALISSDEIIEKVNNDDDEFTDESWTNSLLEDTPKENKAVFNSRNLGESKKESASNKSKSFYSDQLPENFENDVTQSNNQKQKKSNKNHKRSINQIKQDTQDLDDLLESKGSSILAFIAWTFMCLILVAALIGQYIYFNFEHLAHSKSRTQVIQLCEFIGCKVPENTNQIESLNITKFQATQEGDLIRIVFNLTNPQPKLIRYPNLLVQVFDKNNLLLGDEIFKPSEYLPSQIKNENEMRANVNVKGSLLVKDLGEKAVRYQLLLTSKN